MYIAVIDTETNWADQVMSIGLCIAREDFSLVEAIYQVITPEYLVGGMYESTLFADPRLKPVICERPEAIAQLKQLIKKYNVNRIFAYNAAFDRNHLPELRGYQWFDIMRLAAYKQYNPAIPPCADCCSTGRLKRGYGVEAMLQLLAGDYGYHETHNAIFDAVDELQIMRLLGHSLSTYIPL